MYWLRNITFNILESLFLPLSGTFLSFLLFQHLCVQCSPCICCWSVWVPRRNFSYFPVMSVCICVTLTVGVCVRGACGCFSVQRSVDGAPSSVGVRAASVLIPQRPLVFVQFGKMLQLLGGWSWFKCMCVCVCVCLCVHRLVPRGWQTARAHIETLTSQIFIQSWQKTHRHYDHSEISQLFVPT